MKIWIGLLLYNFTYYSFFIIHCNGIGCVDEAEKKCNPAGGNCHSNIGICVCNKGYTGPQCQNRVHINYDVVYGQITNGRMAWIVFLWIIIFPLAILGVLLEII